VPLLERVLEANPEKVKLVFKNFPLRNHKFAKPAASAALAAGKQGKFWEFHDLLFKNYSKLNDEKVKEIATGLGLNEEEFEKERNDPSMAKKIQKDMRDGQKAGVRGTPTIFINGRLLKNRSLQGFQAIIDKEVSKSQK
jgi:protein-disulfide isomerase